MNIELLQKLADEIDSDENAKKAVEEAQQPAVVSGAPDQTPVTTPVNPTVIMDFLANNPAPTDAQFHTFAEEQGFDVHQAESVVYALAAKMVNLMKGGLMNSAEGFSLESVNPNELQKGVKVEMEHTPDVAVAKKIALDHLAEIPDYYTRLAQMESEAKNQANQAANAGSGDTEDMDTYSGNGEAEASNIQSKSADPNSGGPQHFYKQSAYERGFQSVLEKHAKILTSKGRKHVADKNFVFPKEKKYPIHDLAHARNALARVGAFGTEAEKEAVRSAVYSKYPALKKRSMEKKSWWSKEATCLGAFMSKMDNKSKTKKKTAAGKVIRK